jgi:hypothetical protein
VKVSHGGRGTVVVRLFAVDGATSYTLYRGTSAGATTSQGALTVGRTTKAATAGTRYWYRAKATNGDGTSAYGPEVNITVANYTATKPAPTGALLIQRSA